MSDTGKVWFLTGASSNFGIALTRALIKAGHCVVATARTPSKLPFDDNEALLTLRLDVNDLSSISQAFDDAKKHFGRIDVVVNKAGSNTIVELEGFPEAKARDMFGAQFWGPAHVQEIATDTFEAQRSHGLILNVTSTAGVFAAPLTTIMSASKAGSEVLTLARARISPFVTAVNIRPGGFEDHPQAGFEPQPPAYAAKDLGRTLAGTMRSMMSNQSPGQGDVNKMAAALLALAELPREQLPGAVLLGSDAYGVCRAGATKRVAHIQHGHRLLWEVKRTASQSKDPRVWFVANANSTLGQTLVGILLASGHRVAAAIANDGTPSPFTTHDQLLIVRPQSSSVNVVNTVLNDVVEHFGRVDVVANTLSDEAQLRHDDWEAAHELAEHIFWSPINTSSAAATVLRERNPPGAGGRIFNILTTASAEDSSVAVHSALNAAASLGTTALVRELPRKWNIGIAVITIDSDLHADDETARTLISLADLPRAHLPSQLFVGPRALGDAQHAAQIELSETCSMQAMSRAMETDRDHIDSRARIGLFESLLTLILSPSPSIVSQLALILSVLGWGVRMALSESLKGLVARK